MPPAAGLWDVLYGPAFFYMGGFAPATPQADARGGGGAHAAAEGPPAAAAGARAPVSVRITAHEAAGHVEVRLLAAGDAPASPAAVSGLNGPPGSVPASADGCEHHAAGAEAGGEAGAPGGLTAAAEVRAAVVALTEAAAAGEDLEDNTAEVGRVRPLFTPHCLRAKELRAKSWQQECGPWMRRPCTTPMLVPWALIMAASQHLSQTRLAAASPLGQACGCWACCAVLPPTSLADSNPKPVGHAAQLLGVLHHLADPALVLLAAPALARLLRAAPATTGAALAACDALGLLAAALDWQRRAEQARVGRGLCWQA